MPVVPTYDILNCGPNHRFVANGKIVHNSVYNLQNLPKTSQIRNTLIAPPGHTLVIVDSSSIEARVLAWFAEQQDLVEIFQQKGDTYRHMASAIYNIPAEQIARKSKERDIGKCAVLGAGYGMGATKFQATLQKTGINIPFEEAQRIIEIYRKTNNKIVQLWRYLDSQLNTIANGPTKASSFGPSLTSQTTYKCIEFQKNRILLPNGLYLKYPNLQQHDGWTYGNNKKIYGGALCIAGETLVVTNRGNIPLKTIQINDLVWDGENWVNHRGLLNKGLQQTINFGNIYLTPDHKVWTNTGWCPAYETTFNIAEQALLAFSKRPNSKNLWNPFRTFLRRFNKGKNFMESYLHPMFKDKNSKLHRPKKSQILRMFSQTVFKKSQRNSWNDPISDIRRISQHVRTLHYTNTLSLEKLRWTWNKSLWRLEYLRTILQRYGTNIQNRLNLRPNRQQWRLLKNELSMGNLHRKHEQPSMQQNNTNTKRSNDHSPSCTTLPNQRNYPTLPNKEQSTARPPIRQSRYTKQVYDLLDCGPNNRFTIINPNNQAILVHNCENIIQALARIIIGEQALHAQKEVGPVVLLVHDEIVCCIATNQAEQALDKLIHIMQTSPTWAPDLPLDAEGEISAYYKK